METRTTPKDSKAFEARKGPRRRSRDKHSAKFDTKINMGIFLFLRVPRVSVAPLEVGASYLTIWTGDPYHLYGYKTTIIICRSRGKHSKLVSNRRQQ